MSVSPLRASIRGRAASEQVKSMAVARFWFGAGTLYNESARLGVYVYAVGGWVPTRAYIESPCKWRAGGCPHAHT